MSRVDCTVQKECYPATICFILPSYTMLADLAVPVSVATEFCKPADLPPTDAVITKLFEWNAKKNPNYPFYVYQDGSRLEHVTYSMANRAMDRAARYVTAKVGVDIKSAGSTQPPVVGVLASAGER